MRIVEGGSRRPTASPSTLRLQADAGSHQLCIQRLLPKGALGRPAVSSAWHASPRTVMNAPNTWQSVLDPCGMIAIGSARQQSATADCCHGQAVELPLGEAPRHGGQLQCVRAEGRMCCYPFFITGSRLPSKEYSKHERECGCMKACCLRCEC